MALDRNLAEAHAQIGRSRYFLGRAAETEAHMNEALRLSPRDINAFDWLMITGFSKLQLAADAEALNWLLRSLEANRNYPLAHFARAGPGCGNSRTCARSKLYGPSLPRRRVE